jgi:uncharacterized protein (DUF1499 family)
MKISVRIGICIAVSLWLGCGGRMPEGLGADRGLLAPCPNKPNCVSSFAGDEDHRIDALAIEGSDEAAWQSLRRLLESAPRVEIVTSSTTYIHAVYTTPIMRYRDDVEFFLRTDENEIAVRSASRVGYSDMGLNRERIEAIRTALRAGDA